ncbi:uncharacterized protein LOC129307712 [Prosopis cineraria]|uniref:uncharacterized protein LOC129307712 n=1 Tax=Prosopis cineraria TaxID=364024 RepID=UPI00240F327A|nr:uncharacterized protein LOC129307712 [Prosopis cineraria]
MESNSLSSFVRILRESLHLFLKNKGLMTSIAMLILLLHSFLFSCNYFSIEPFTKDFVKKRVQLFFARPGTSKYTNIVTSMTSDFRMLAGLEWFFILALSMASLFSSATTVLASAVTYAEGNLSFLYLLSRVFKSCKRLIITWFYVSLFNLGYLLLAFSLIFPFTVNFAFPLFRPTTFVYVMLIPVSAFHTYLAVVWKMSVVISVLEEKRGLEAFGKAWQILKGLKTQGFLLNLVYDVLALIGYIWWYMESPKKGTYYSLVMGLMLLNVGCLIKMLVDMAFTVLYHMCKLSHGEEIEFERISKYIKVSNEPTIGADVA